MLPNPGKLTVPVVGNNNTIKMTLLVQHYFERSAKQHPDKMAIACNGNSLTYAEADALSNAAANRLLELGVSRSSFIPFFMPKSVDAVVSILSILKADCAYVPIDPGFPPPRILSILDATRPPMIIVTAESGEQLQAIIPSEKLPPLFVIDEVEGGNTEAPDYQNLSIDIAYVLFTSGSTGTPKGVMIPHRAIVDYIDWCVDEYGITDADVVANHAPLNFDNSTFDLYTAFAAGAELHLVHDRINAVITSLIRWIADHRITIFFCVPSVLGLLARTRRLKDDSFPDLRRIICAGEALPPGVLRTWMMKYPTIRFTNMYGPTEITVDCCYHHVESPPAEDDTRVPIGRARPNMEMFVRQEDGSLSQAPGAAGELLVRGTSVAYGYLGDAAKTQAAFIQHPGHSLYHDLLYCTGDLVEIDDDGDYYFRGRADQQIKFLGYRIELGEIEAALANLAGVDEAVVVFRDGETAADMAIGALYRLSDGAALNPGEMLKSKLPSYMLPARFVQSVEPLPKTPNGKFDRQQALALVFGTGES